VSKFRPSVLLLSAALLVPSTGRAQFQPVPPQAMPAGPIVTGAGAQLNAPVQQGFIPPAFWPSGYSNPWIYSPAGAYLSGLADLTNAQGQYLQQVQQARILQNQADSGRLDMRRKIWEQEAWERRNTPTADQVRAFQADVDLQRARNNPPNNYIWSGAAMNTLMTDIQRMHAAGINGPPVAVDQDLLRRISLTDGASSRGGIALLAENGGKMTWPFVLRKKVFEKDRQTIENLSVQAAMQARSDNVDPDTVDGIRKASGRIRDQIRIMSQNDDLTPTEAIQGRRFLTELDGALRTLADPNVAKFFNGQWAPKGSTVGEIIDNMTRQGLTFAPAISGNEAAYTSFFNALVTYDLRLAQLAPAPQTGKR
jgi:hypothetical protein